VAEPNGSQGRRGLEKDDFGMEGLLGAVEGHDVGISTKHLFTLDG
jgi:hypothetical protein